MANLLKTEIISNSKNLTIFKTDEVKPITGRTDIVYYHLDTKISYTWDGSKYIELSKVETDLTVVDTFDKLPVSGTEDGFYLIKNTEYLYVWNGTSYAFVKQVMNIVTQLITGIRVKYNHASVTPDEIFLNETYIVKWDSKTYLEYLNKKVYMDTKKIVTYFLPIDGRQWTDVYGTYTPPEPTIIAKTDEQKGIINSLKQLFDTNNDGFIDYAKDTEKFAGKTVNYYANKKYIIKSTDFVLNNVTKLYEYTLSHNRNTEDLVFNFRNTNKQLEFVDVQILDKNNIKVTIDNAKDLEAICCGYSV